MDEDRHVRLEPMARVIARSLTLRPEHFITHPAELRLFHTMGDAELRDFAHERGWRVVRRIGGRQIEFYNDAYERMERVRTGNSRPEDERFE
ncbi:MAG: hypothetical protein ABI540_04125 [Spartobacteria bacterium]